MANPKPADLFVDHNGTELSLCHDYMNIGLSENGNWVDAAIALYNCMDSWRKDSSDTWYVDEEFRGGINHPSIRIGRVILDWEKMEITFDGETEEYGYDGGQFFMFQQLQDVFNKIKKIPVFL